VASKYGRFSHDSGTLCPATAKLLIKCTFFVRELLGDMNADGQVNVSSRAGAEHRQSLALEAKDRP
jgi:hypothetical protein